MRLRIEKPRRCFSFSFDVRSIVRYSRPSVGDKPCVYADARANKHSLPATQRKEKDKGACAASTGSNTG